MQSWALFFFLMALVLAIFGFGGFFGAVSGIAQLLFAGFLLLAVLVVIVDRDDGTFA